MPSMGALTSQRERCSRASFRASSALLMPSSTSRAAACALVITAREASASASREAARRTWAFAALQSASADRQAVSTSSKRALPMASLS